MQSNDSNDDADAIKNESEPTKTGERWEDHSGERFTSEVTDDGILLNYDDGSVEGPVPRDEFEDSRDRLNYLGEK